MAGHSKWANIQHRKGAQDKKRGKLFTKLIREITVSAKMGGGDASANPRLRAAIDAALSNNMPKDTIERAVKRGSGGMDGESFDEVRYEGYGPGGAARITSYNVCYTKLLRQAGIGNAGCGEPIAVSRRPTALADS